MRTITAAARELRVGKTRLYSLLTETGVEPFQQGKSRMIDDAQLQILQNAIHPTLDPNDDPKRPAKLTGRPEEREKRSSGPSESSTEHSEPYKELVQRMSSEIDHLRELLTSERADRQKREDEVSTERTYSIEQTERLAGTEGVQCLLLTKVNIEPPPTRVNT